MVFTVSEVGSAVKVSMRSSRICASSSAVEEEMGLGRLRSNPYADRSISKCIYSIRSSSPCNSASSRRSEKSFFMASMMTLNPSPLNMSVKPFEEKPMR